VRTWFNQRFKRIETMTSVKIDSNRKTIEVELDLIGEASSIQLQVDHYELAEHDGKTLLCLGNIKTSRPWLNVILDEYLMDRKFVVPKMLSAVL
jgi:hypothetical protein